MIQDQKGMLSSANSAGNIPPGKKLTGGKRNRKTNRRTNRKRNRKNTTVWV